MTIGNGERASFWFDNLSSLGRLRTSNSNNAQIPLGILLQATVAQARNSYRKRSFRSPDLRSLAEVAEKVFQNLNASSHDKDKWKAKAGVFLSKFHLKNTWQLIRHTSPPMMYHQAIWFPKATPKFSFLVWLAHMNRLSTGDRHTSWTSRDQVKCLLCGCLLESRDHLFFICRFSWDIWKSISGTLLQLPSTQTWESNLTQLAKGTPSKTTTFLARYTFQTTVYYIWRERNSRKHGSGSKTSMAISQLIDKEIRNKISSMELDTNHLSDDTLQVWLQTR